MFLEHYTVFILTFFAWELRDYKLKHINRYVYLSNLRTAKNIASIKDNFGYIISLNSKLCRSS